MVFSVLIFRVWGFFEIDSSPKFYFYIWIIVALSILGLIRLQHSRIGRAWNYIREDAVAAEANGIDVRFYKLLAFILGAAMAGCCGQYLCEQADDRLPGELQFHGILSDVLYCAYRRHGIDSRGGDRCGGHQSFPGNLSPLCHVPYADFRTGDDPDDDIPARGHMAAKERGH